MNFDEINLPSKCGVYIFKDIFGNPLYIGKAKDIKKRVKSHFQEEDSKKHKLLELTEKIDFIITPNELSALFLENDLIKKYQPKFNVNLKDDKTYPFIEITIKDKFPKIFYTRKIKEDSIYFGPFYPARKPRKIISFIQRNFGICSCKRNLNKEYKKPCLYFYMKRCLGPCVPNLTNKNIYKKKLEQAILFLKGKNEKLLKEIKKEIEEKAKKLRFEEAKDLKEIYLSIEEMKKTEKIYKAKGEDFDVFGIYNEGSFFSLIVLNFKRGTLFGKKSYIFEKIEIEDKKYFLEQVLPQYYISNPVVPEKIILPFDIKEEIFLDFLKEEKGKVVKIKVPKRGRDKDLLKLAEENAKEIYQNRFPNRGIEELKKILDLEKLFSIIGIDISHFQGRIRYGGVVFFEGGIFDKKKYRTFKLNTKDPRDDPKGIYEIVKRYILRNLREEKGLPDLILIDGGKAQISMGKKALEEIKINIPLISLEKTEEKVFMPDKKEPLLIEKNSPALLLLQKIRDEAHRFVITLHRRVSRKSFFK